MTNTEQHSAPQPLNIVEVETPWGHRTFELHHADITRLGCKVDAIVFSSYVRDLLPLPGTVIEALEKNLGLELASVSATREFDFTESLGSWVSGPLSTPEVERLVCVELRGGALQPDEVLENLFVVLSILEMKRIPIRSVALPVLGAGRQRLDPSTVIPVLLRCALDHMKRSAVLERVVFVEVDHKRALQLSDEMNKALDRVRIVLPRGTLTVNIRQEIISTVDQIMTLRGLDTAMLFQNIRRVIASEDSRSFEIGIIARRLAELVTDNIVGAGAGIDLFMKIEKTASHGIAPWIRSYLHVLRVFGNESAHERDRENRKPASITESDLALCFFCLLRVLSFHLDWCRDQQRTWRRG